MIQNNFSVKLLMSLCQDNLLVNGNVVYTYDTIEVVYYETR